MRLRHSSFLGLAVGDREIACVQIAGGTGRRSRARAARFDIPADLSLEKPDALGATLKAFLAEHRMGASRAVVGVPARWLIAEPRELPPTNRQQALASLRLQAERISLGDDDRLIFDAAGTYGDARPGHALLVGLSEQRLEQIKRLCAAAGLSPAAVTATGLVVAQSVPGPQSGEGAVIMFSGEGAEMVLRSAKGPRIFRHLSGVRGQGVLAGGGATSLPSLSSELWRVLAMGGTGEPAADRSVLLLGDSGLGTEDCDALSGRLGRRVDCADAREALRQLPAAASLNGQSDQVATERLWPAVALAGAGNRLDALPVNFLRPRLAPPRVSRWNRTKVLAVATVLVIVGGLGMLWWDTRASETQLAALEERLRQLDPEIKAADSFIDRVHYARGYFKSRPSALDALHDLSQSFGREDRIWITSFSIRDNGKGQISGRAADQESVLMLQRRLLTDPRFSDVNMGDIHEAVAGQSRGGRAEIGFSLTFTYLASSRRQVAP